MPIKKRIELTRTTNKNGGIEDVQIENGDETNNEEEPGFIFENIPEIQPEIEIGQYWKVKNGTHSLYAVISSKEPIEVQYFEPTVQGNFHSLNETEFEVFLEDLDEKIEPPKILRKGRTRTFYDFE